MKVQNCKYVSMQYTLSLESGEVADRSPDGEPMGFIFGAAQVLPALEENLRGLEAGQNTKVRLAAREAFGEREEALVRDLPRASFPAGEEVREGMVFLAQSPLGTVPFRIRTVSDESVVADFNHPLAGENLYFDVRIEEVRDLTTSELLSGPTECKIGRFVS
jgi:FKBP-type peptidyl-prolyl cis-trans isomerase 2